MAEILARVSSGYYNAEMLLQHALAQLSDAPQAEQQGSATHSGMSDAVYAELPDACGELPVVGFDYPVFDADQMRAFADATRLAKVWERGVVSAIRPADIAKYLRVYRAEAPIVANREVAVLSNLFNLAIERGDIDRNPCKEVRRNREAPRTRLVEVHEL
ncbi:hypothetical protein [Acidovorax sp. FG27]|uniref:hypothetical protein n=1 Tax=Acidovorax sp. FG27 TaxID=3133652 RepID=UPI00333E8856